jgi:hypothetical protein
MVNFGLGGGPSLNDVVLLNSNSVSEPPLPTLTPTTGTSNNSDASTKIVLDLPGLTAGETRTYTALTGPTFGINATGDVIRGAENFAAGSATGRIDQIRGGVVRASTNVSITLTDNPVITLTQPPAETADDTPTVAGHITWVGHTVSGLTVDISVDGGAASQATSDSNGDFTYEITPALSSGVAHTINVSVNGFAASGSTTNVTIVAVDAATTAYVNACVAAGYTPDATFTNHIDTLIKALKAGASPAWDNYDVVMPLAVPSALAARCLKTPTRGLTLNNSPTFTADRGYTGNGSNAYITFNPGYNPGAGGLLLTQNDMHVGVYSLTQGTSGSYQFGTVLSNTIRVRGRIDTNSAVSLASSTGLASISAQAMPRHVVGIRRESTIARLFSQGVQNTQGNINSGALSSFAWGLFRTNSADYSDAQVAFVHAGKAHSDAQALQEHNAIKAYLQVRGAVA